MSDSDQESVEEPSSRISETSGHNSTLFASQLEVDDEVYIFECPAAINPKSFLKTKIDLSKESEIEDKVTQQMYNITLEPCVRTILVAAPKGSGAKIRQVSVVGVLNAERKIRVKKPKLAADSDDEVPFPAANLVSRHPLLGVNWEKQDVKKSSKYLKKKSKKEKQIT